MKYPVLLAASLIIFPINTKPDVAPVVTSAEVVARGPNSRIWKQTHRATLPNGQIITNFSTISELATGMHYLSNDQWVESSTDIELFQDGAVARHGPHQVIFAPNINAVEGAIDMMSADNKRFRSSVIGLIYVDYALEQSVLIAEIQDSIGELHAPNQVIYPDAFAGIKADVRYTYTRAGFEQDIILRENPPSPLEFGFNPATTRLEVITEFIDPPIPSKSTRMVRGFEDEILNFGLMQIAYGKAFSIEGAINSDRTQPVAKGWKQLQEGTFLVESLSYEAIRSDLELLPARNQGVNLKKPRNGNMAWVGEKKQRQAALQPKKEERILLAKGNTNARGYVIDYNNCSSGSSVLLDGFSTHYVSGDVIITNLTIEGGAVVKYASGASIEVISSVICKTAPYRPAILTAKDDSTVGAPITGAGELSGYYADAALSLHNASHALKHLRISHAVQAVSLDNGDVTADNCQFTYCQKALVLDDCAGYFNNVLVYSASNVVSGDLLVLKGQHLTASYCTKFTGDANTNGSVTLTNSIFLQVSSLGNSTFITNKLLRSTDDSIFQTVGAGRHFLADNSPYRNAGTTNIMASLLSELRTKTTYPPLLLTNEISLSTVLEPQVPRDTDLPDYGYHYDAIDYAISSVNVTNTSLILTNGVAFASFGNQGFLVRDYATIISEGSPQRPNIFTRYYSIQEETTNWGNAISILATTINPYNAGNSPPTVRLRFTESNVQSFGGYHTYANLFTPPGWNFTSLEIRNSWIHGGYLLLYETNTATLAFTNSILENVYHDLWPIYVETENSLAPKGYVQSALLRAVQGEWIQATTNVVTWKILDSLLDTSPFYNNSWDLVHQYNRFYSSPAFYENYPTNNTELILTSLSYQTGPLGNYYQPTNSLLINSGSLTNASLIGLYHFTTTTNQVKETNSWLDLGLHYVAVNSTTGQPLDADGDGLPDYFEDRNGNGTADPGETDWTAYDSMFGIEGGTGLVVFTPVKE